MGKYTPFIEQYSIDESFLYFDGFDRYDLEEYCSKMRKEILQQTLIPTCVGIAPTKTLAKLANRIAKKFPDLGGVHIIDSEEKRIKALKWLDVEDIWGIGTQLSKRLREINVKNAYEFTQLDDELLRNKFSVVEVRRKMDLLGIPAIEIEDVKAKKHIANTRSFEITTSNRNYIEERVYTYAVGCAEKLRKQGSTCRIVTVFIHTNRFKEHDEQYYRTINITIPFATNSSIEIAKYALKGFEQIFRPGLNYKKAGVIVSGIEPENAKQLNLFEDEHPKHRALMKAMDKLNGKYGERKLRMAAQDHRTVKMRQGNLSQKYTTDWNQLLKIK